MSAIGGKADNRGVFNAADTVQAPLCGLGRFRVVMPTIYLSAALVFLALGYSAITAKRIASTPPTQANPAG
jgi:hypothetical protein